MSLLENEEKDLMRLLGRHAVQMRSKQAEIDRMKSELSRIKQGMMTVMSGVEMLEEKTTGWMVMLKRSGDAWESVGCFDSNNPSDDDLPEFHLILPIPVPSSLPEWEGL